METEGIYRDHPQSYLDGYRLSIRKKGGEDECEEDESTRGSYYECGPIPAGIVHVPRRGVSAADSGGGRLDALST